jgi:hypothetical protein
MGRHKNITPKEFLALWDEYKTTIDSNPDQIQKATNKGVQTEAVKKPYLRQGFEAYVYRKRGFHIHQYIDNYQDAYADFLGVVTCARKEWEDDQIGGTMTGRYKAQNLTARINGLTDKSESNVKVDGPIFKGIDLDVPKDNSTGEDS